MEQQDNGDHDGVPTVHTLGSTSIPRYSIQHIWIDLSKKVCLNTFMSVRHRITSAPPVAPVALDDLARRTAELWAVEPQTSTAQRFQLLTELGELDDQIDRLMVRSRAGITVNAIEVRQCAQRYLWLRQQWGDSEVAA
jgi:hypothetical protein